MLDCFIEIFLAFLAVIVAYKILDRFVRYPEYGFLDIEYTKYILITGCDRGFGELLAKRCDSRGRSVFAACLTQEGVERIRKHSSRLRMKAFIMDVSNQESLQNGLKFVEDNMPGEEGLWALVNNAGISGGKLGPVDWMDADDFRSVCEVNLFGLINTTKTFLPLVKKAKGRIVNMTSISGRCCMTGMGPYSVSKYAAEAFSDTLRREVKAFGVSLHILEPGFFNTALVDPQTFRKMIANAWTGMPEVKRQEYGEEYRAGLEVLTTELVPKIASKNLDIVIATYEHAIFAWYPRARYLIGWNARLVIHPLSLLPEWLSDFLFGLGLRKPAATLKTKV